MQAEGKARALLIDRANNTRAWRYMHHDHLGSVTLVTDHTGAVQARYGFDAWGARRNANGTAQTGTIAPEVDRGYTGHEMLDNVGIVHMNGRLYDPQIARMISADPTIPHPENLQAYSRYAYVYNDPLNKWDPSGYKPKWGKLLLGLAIAALTQQWYLAETTMLIGTEAGVGLVTTNTLGLATNAAVGGALSGFAGGLVASGGDFKAAAYGALSGGMFGAAGTIGAGGNVAGQMALHAGAGCISGALGGGGAEGCARGALSQVVSKAVTIGTRELFKGMPGAHFASAVIAGGTASAVTGGKFANGAITGAFGYVLNEATSKGFSLRARGYIDDPFSQFGRGISEFFRNFTNMDNANTIGADKFFHCRANCEASQRGPFAEEVAEKFSNAREILDQASGTPRADSVQDQHANKAGREAGRTTSYCSKSCEAFRPITLNPDPPWLPSRQRELPMVP